MNEQTTHLLKNKFAKIFLKNSFCYTGQIMEISDVEILLLDKYGSMVSLTRDEVSTITEERRVR